MSIKDKYHVLPIDKKETYPWLRKKHYAKRMPPISYAFGLYNNDRLVQGVCTYGKPASNDLCRGICGEDYKSLVYELNRLCVNDNLPQNTLSYFVSQTLKSLPQDLIIVSYADTSHNHHGYIYQATNWIYTGLSIKMIDKFDLDNPNKHSRHTDKIVNVGYRERPRKHRYIMFLGNKRQKKDMLKNLKYKQEPYPKGDNKRYDATFKPEIQLRLF